MLIFAGASSHVPCCCDELIDAGGALGPIKIFPSDERKKKIHKMNLMTPKVCNKVHIQGVPEDFAYDQSIKFCFNYIPNFSSFFSRQK
jgi:hypothetical protein